MSETTEKTEDVGFKIEAIDASEGGPFVEAFNQFTCASARAWLELELTCPEFRNMAQDQKVNALVNGTLAGVMAMVMSKMKDEYADQAVEYIKNCIEPAKVNAVTLIEEWKRDASQFVREQEGCAPDAKLN